jgi:hypothetical protein
MTLHTLSALERVARCAASDACRSAISRQIEAVGETVGAGQHVTVDKLKLADAVERAASALASQSC